MDTPTLNSNVVTGAGITKTNMLQLVLILQQVPGLKVQQLMSMKLIIL